MLNSPRFILRHPVYQAVPLPAHMWQIFGYGLIMTLRLISCEKLVYERNEFISAEFFLFAHSPVHCPGIMLIYSVATNCSPLNVF